MRAHRRTDAFAACFRNGRAWRIHRVAPPTVFLPTPAVGVRRFRAAELQFKLARRRQRKTCFWATKLLAAARASNTFGRFERLGFVPSQAAISHFDVNRLAVGP